MPRIREKSIARGDEAVEAGHAAARAGPRLQPVAAFAKLPVLPLDIEAEIEILGIAAALERGAEDAAGQGAGGGSPRAKVICPSQTAWPSTRATPLRLPILALSRTTVASSITVSPATTGRR